MHAVYAFLVDSDCVSKAGSAEALFDAEYAINYCDENNWYQMMMVVYEDGDMESLISGEDWRGREWMQKQYEQMPQEERWEAARAFAASIVAVDFELYGDPMFAIGIESGKRKLDDMSFDELLHDIQSIVPQKLHEFYRDRVGTDPTDDRFDLELYRATQDAVRYSLFMQSVRLGKPFFSEPTGPYDNFRSMDLRPWRSDEDRAKLPEDNKLGIIFVDLHT